MTHYQKLATMIFRVVGAVILIGCSVILAGAFIFDVPMKYSLFFYSVAPYSAVSLILLALSKILAKLICSGFEDSNEQQ